MRVPTIVIFIGLKLAEAAAIVAGAAAFYLIGIVTSLVFGFTRDGVVDTILSGIIGCIVMLGITAVGFLIFLICDSNWQKAKHISSKINNKR
jgi:hypothetical protein